MIHELLMEACQADGWSIHPGNKETRVVVPLGEDRHQEILVVEEEEGGESVVRFYTIIGPIQDLTGNRPLAALRLNYGLLSCSFAAHMENLILIRTQVASYLDPKETRATIRLLAETGDRYEKHLYGTDVH